MLALSPLIFVNAFVNAFLAGSRFFLPIILYVVYAWCCPSFSLCYLFLHFFKDDVELINLADLLIQLCSYLFHPWHIWGSFLTLSPRFFSKTTNFSIYAISFECFLTFQCSQESHLVPLEDDFILLPSPFFFTLCQLYLFVPQLVQPLLSGIPQIVISCVFIDQDSIS